MPTIVIETTIDAAQEVCFDLIRDARVHDPSTRVIADETTKLGGTITFETRQWGLSRRMTMMVIECDRPRRLVDAMVRGSFSSFYHVHDLANVNNGTVLTDTLFWESPYGMLGSVFDKVALERHLRRIVTERNARLKRLAEEGK